MQRITTQLYRIAKFIGILGIFKDFFGDEVKLSKLYRVLMGALIAYVVGRTAYMSYRVFKNGYVKEIQRRVDDDEEGGDYGNYGENEGDAPFPEEE